MRTVHDIIQRVRAEFVEMPGLQLKAAQLQRLCGIDRVLCEVVLQSLMDERFLWMKPDGHYARRTEGPMPHPQPALASLRLRRDRPKAS
jgi:hypothetical protein